jgi:hypothetical protein
MEGSQSTWLIDAYRWLKMYAADESAQENSLLDRWLSGTFSFLVKDVGFGNRRVMLDRFLELVEREQQPPPRIEF